MVRAGKLILRYTFTFAVFCGTAGLLLPAVYELVEPRKAAYQQELKLQSLRLVSPGAEDFEPAQTAAGQAYYRAYADGQLLGYVLEVRARGYSSELQLLVGLDRSYAVTGLRTLAQAETPGLGTRITEPAFAAQFLGRPAEALALRQDGGSLDALTGATITSRAVADGIRRAVADWRATL
ncbi:MAG: RnfABCDGE type electron transport complex subunit G [Candidatus Margulisbacteria bacterium]|jgi:electron transport complex protein RnfG|nr:RnfABCDGE type electron transport complex subunit G [Candidatus Margulisiibacteriota bacterium]